jgi:hypothetical protein
MDKNIENNSKTKRHILSDHQKVGKKFIPPFLQLGKFNEVKWIDCILPELLWLGLLNNQYDLAKGADLAISLARSATKVCNSGSKIWFAPINAYATLTKQQKNEINKSLKASNNLDSLQEALTPLFAFYPECPLNFLSEERNPNSLNSKENLEQFKLLLSTLFNRHEKAATLIQANAIYIAFVTDFLKVVNNTDMANFPLVAEFPNTEESVRVAAGVRNTVNVFFGGELYDKSSTWPKYFWNRGLELEACDYQGIYEKYER